MSDTLKRWKDAVTEAADAVTWPGEPRDVIVTLKDGRVWRFMNVKFVSVVTSSEDNAFVGHAVESVELVPSRACKEKP